MTNTKVECRQEFVRNGKLYTVKTDGAVVYLYGGDGGEITLDTFKKYYDATGFFDSALAQFFIDMAELYGL